MSAAEIEGSSGRTKGSDELTIRLTMPDRWLEEVVEVPASTPLSELKRRGLEAMLSRPVEDPDAYYLEYAEKQVPDETVSLETLGAQSREVLSIRAYDLGHYPRFQG